MNHVISATNKKSILSLNWAMVISGPRERMHTHDCMRQTQKATGQQYDVELFLSTVARKGNFVYVTWRRSPKLGAEGAHLTTSKSNSGVILTFDTA